MRPSDMVLLTIAARGKMKRLLYWWHRLSGAACWRYQRKWKQFSGYYTTSNLYSYGFAKERAQETHTSYFTDDYAVIIYDPKGRPPCPPKVIEKGRPGA